MNFTFSKHALEQLKNRDIDIDLAKKVLQQPDQIIKTENQAIYQAVIGGKSKKYLIRIFVNTSKKPPVVITAYKTSKLNKYYEG